MAGQHLWVQYFDADRAARLLGRSPRVLDLRPARRALRDRTVLVTGAGGSIGMEVCRQLAVLGAGRVVALDHSDHALIDVVGAVKAERPKVPVVDVLCDVRDPQRLSAVMDRTRPDIVIHAAALKHVHMGDRHPAESVLTNLLGVRNAAEAAARAGASRFLLVSSDKAAAPGSVMGASKRLAELYLRNCARTLAERGVAMRMRAVRFGNVLGSKGSVAPLFVAQIANGGPVTITHPEMRRYFMTIEEAVQLILLVCAAEEDGENGASYLLDMGEPVKIVDMARRMMEDAGVTVPMVTTGLREGEKLDETLYDENECVEAAGIEGVSRIVPAAADAEITAEDLAELERSVRAMSDDIVRHLVFSLLDERLGVDRSAVG